MVKPLNLKGKQFGKLTVIKRVENDKHGKAKWLCKCECGNQTTPSASDLRSGKSKTCGCSRVTHGLSHHRTHVIFTQMKVRCYNPSNISYPWYGGKGVEICEQWKDDFPAFHEWAVNNGYQDGLEIDRIDSNGNYSPDNCRWVDRVVQGQNQKIRSDNTSGVRGVKWNSSRSKWEVGISVNKKRLYLGLYEDFDEAVKVRREAEEKHWRNNDMV